jgi:hypothetical protein
MKKYSGGAQAASLALFAALALLLFRPAAAAAQTEEEAPIQREERVDTGRFGAEEAETPPPAPEEERAYNKRLYLGFRAGPSLRFYTPPGDTAYTGGEAYGFSVEAALHAAVRILPFLTIQGEAVFSWDNASIWAYHRVGQNSEIDRYTWDHRSFSLQFPLTVRLNLYPGKFRLSPFLGAYYILPLGNFETVNSLNMEGQSNSYTVSPPIGLLGGLSGALKLGPGNIFAELRYAADLGEPEAGNLPTYRRSMLTLSLGYEWGFIEKKGSKRHE